MQTIAPDKIIDVDSSCVSESSVDIQYNLNTEQLQVELNSRDLKCFEIHVPGILNLIKAEHPVLFNRAVERDANIIFKADDLEELFQDKVLKEIIDKRDFCQQEKDKDQKGYEPALNFYNRIIHHINTLKEQNYEMGIKLYGPGMQPIQKDVKKAEKGLNTN